MPNLTPEEAQKARERARAYIEKGIREGDILPDLPGPDLPLYSPVGGLAGRINPYLGAVLGAYAMLENTERWWGPRLFEGYGEGYPEPKRPQALMHVPGVTKVAVKPKRKLTKSNKAMSGLYKFLAKEQKSRMTQAKARKLLTRCAKIVGKANPNTKSRIGKGKSTNQKLARKCRMDYWGTKKRN